MIYRFRKEELEAHLNKNALWAIVYGDMMSYLMIFFLVMLSFQVSQNINQEDRKVEETLGEITRVFGGEPSEKLKARIRDSKDMLMLGERVEKLKEEQDLGEAVEAVVTEKWVKIKFADEFLFDSGSADLKDAASPILEVISQSMMNKKNQIRVEGHTDDRKLIPGSRYRNNFELSMARAHSVIMKLLELGIDAKVLAGSGYGEHHPIADNKTAEGRAKNRRIEIKVLRAE